MWIGVVVVVGLLSTEILALLLAAPAGVLISIRLNRMRKPNIIENVEPR